MARALAPLVAALLGLLGSLGATLSLYRGASAALDRVLDERLRGAGESAALLFADVAPSPERLAALMKANDLDGAYVVGEDLRVEADATGPSGGRVDLLRADATRLRRAFTGEASVATSYALGALDVWGGYFPIRREGMVRAVLALEAGQAFSSARADLRRALWLGVGLSVLAALALAVVAQRYGAAERLRQLEAARAARGEVLAKMAAMAAHEIRNPLGVIRGTVELMRERAGAALSERDRTALEDVLAEVERLRRLTEDFLDLSADRPLARSEVDLGQLLGEAASATEALFPSVRVARDLAPLPALQGDAGRLRQVFANLLSNAAQAQGSGELALVARAEAGRVRVEVRDRGPGLAPEIRERLFDPFVTTRAGGTGLGLALSRRFVERHGGTLTLSSEPGAGTTARVELPTGPARSP